MFDMQHFEGSAKENGMHYWLAHEFMAALGYETWPSFKTVIQKAMGSCLQLGIDTDEAFLPCDIPDGTKSYKLTRFACFLIAMQADSKKPQVSSAQIALAKIAEVLVEEKLSESLYDFMDITELAANTFWITQTAEMLKRTKATGLTQARIAAHQVGKEVRDVMMRSSGVAPEDLPLEGHIEASTPSTSFMESATVAGSSLTISSG